MNDRFKFRVWNPDGKYYDDNPQYNVAIEIDQTEGLILSAFHNNIIEFCTGLKDKNGNLIYEGDIVRGEKETGTVKYGKHPRTNSDSLELGFYIDWKMKHPWRSDICYWTSPENPDCIEIIGNIHEQGVDKC